MEGALLGNVAAALILEAAPASASDRDAAQTCAQTLSRLFQDVLLVGEGASRIDVPERARVVATEAQEGLVSAAVEAASADRILLIDAPASALAADVFAGLAAWPEAQAVVLARESTSKHCATAICQRAASLAVLEEEPTASLASLVERLAGDVVSLAALGLSDGSAEAC